MSKERGPFYLYIDGEAVPVTAQIYHEYRYFERKEEYFTYDLKVERFVCDQNTQTVAFVPSREDSYERLLKNNQFSQDEPTPEDQVILSAWLASALATLSDNERYIIYEVVMKQRTEREVSKELGVSQNTIHYHKRRALNQLKNFLEKNS